MPARRDAGLLEARDDGVAARAGGRLAGHAVVAFLVVALVGLVALAASAVLGGWLLQTYVLPDHGIGHADEHVNVVLAHHRSGLRSEASLWISRIADVPILPAVVGLAALVFAALRRWRVAGFLVGAIVVEAATYRIVTFAIQRQRPHVRHLDHLPLNASYYSGHTAAAVAVYCGIALLVASLVRSTGLRASVWFVAAVIPLLVALSRMYRGMHHPTDVAAGVLVGIGTLVVAAAAARAAAAASRPR